MRIDDDEEVANETALPEGDDGGGPDQESGEEPGEDPGTNDAA